MTWPAAGEIPTGLSSESPRGDLEKKLEPYHVAIILTFGLLVRVWLIHTFPVIFGGDSIARLANRDTILLSYQLPLLQAAVHYLGSISTDVVLVRWFMAVAGAVAGWGFYLLASTLLDRRDAFVAALFFVTSPFVLAYSTVPYQEILMLAGLFFAFYFFFVEQWFAASAVLALACFTRYESWIAVPVFVSAFALLQPGPKLVSLTKAALLFGWAPLAWTLYHTGLAPQGTFVLDLWAPLERFWRYVYLSWVTVKFTPLPVLLLGASGLWRFWRQGLWRSHPYLMLAVFVALFLAAILYSAHGVRDQPERFVTARESQILLSAVALLAGLGFSRLPRFRIPALALCVLWGGTQTYRLVASETAQPKLRLSYSLIGMYFPLGHTRKTYTWIGGFLWGTSCVIPLTTPPRSTTILPNCSERMPNPPVAPWSRYALLAIGFGQTLSSASPVSWTGHSFWRYAQNLSNEGASLPRNKGGASLRY